MNQGKKRLGRCAVVSGLVLLATLFLTDQAEGQCGVITEFQAPNSQPGYSYGWNVALDGDVAVISMFDAAAYVYRWNGASWNLEAELLPSDGAPGRFFAESMAISGDVIVIGAGDWDDDVLGAAYVYRRVNGVWSEDAILTASDGNPGDWFGIRAVMEDDLIVVWSPNNQTTEGVGTIYIFRDIDGDWIEEEKITVLRGENYWVDINSFTINQGRISILEDFGRSIAIYQHLGGIWSETERITLPDESGLAIGLVMSSDDLIITSNPSIDDIVASGFSFYRWDGLRWQFTSVQHFPGDQFSSVSLAGGALVFGNTQSQSSNCDPGSIFYYRRGDDRWVPVRQFILADRQPGDRLGIRVVTNGEVVLASSFLAVSRKNTPGAAFMFSLEGPQFDCNTNLIEDGCEIISDFDGDCNGNGVPDECDISQGIESDHNLDGVPDSCPVLRALEPCLIDRLHAEAASNSRFTHVGSTVAISSDVAVVGGRGKVKVFRRFGLEWTPESVLVGDSPDGKDGFGTSVATNGSVIVVGTPWDWEDEEGSLGATYVFRYDPQARIWKREVKLKGGVITQRDLFGTSVAISEDTIVVGALPREGLGHGSVYVYRFLTTTWRREAVIASPAGQFGDWFGFGVDIDGNTLVVGARNDAGHVVNHGGPGAVYVFERHGTEWRLSNKFSPTTNSEFTMGRSVAVDGNRILAGSIVSSPPCSNDWNGAVTIFVRDSESWKKKERIILPFSNDADSVDLSGNTALVGSMSDQNNISAGGAAFVYRLDHDEEKPPVLILNPQPQTQDIFGQHVALEGDYAIISTRNLEDDAALGILYAGFSLDDCNANGESDLCEINVGTVRDRNRNGIPDECERPGDVNRRRQFGVTDLLDLLAVWGSCPDPCPWDFNHDGQVNVTDLLNLLRRWR